MGTRPVDGLLKELTNHFPYTPPSDIYPDQSQHTWLWNMALREGRQQVILWIAEYFGVQLPAPDKPEDFEDVFSTQGRAAPSSDASARSRPGGEHP